METKKKRVEMTPKLFSAVKLLLESKAPYKEITKYLGVSESNISKVSASETWEEYLAILAAEAKKQRERFAARKAAEEAYSEKAKEEKKRKLEPVAEAVGAVPAASLVTPPAQTVQQMITVPYRLYEVLQKQTEILTGISNKLAYIVEELAGVPSPKRDEKGGESA